MMVSHSAVDTHTLPNVDDTDQVDARQKKGIWTQESAQPIPSCYEETCTPWENLGGHRNDTGTIWRAEKLDFQELDFKGRVTAAQENESLIARIA
jgi:hypothetical protein